MKNLAYNMRRITKNDPEMRNASSNQTQHSVS